MNIRHELCLDSKVDSRQFQDAVLTALGHSPELKLRAEAPEDTVHGAVSIAQCDPRTLGKDLLVFKDSRLVVVMDAEQPPPSGLTELPMTDFLREEFGSTARLFFSGRVEIASADNINDWWIEQEHKLVKIVGDQAYGNTIINLKITSTDEAPNRFHRTTYKRPAVMPTEQECRDRIDGCHQRVR